MSSEIVTQGQQILVDPETGEMKKAQPQPGADLVSWVVGKVGPWRDHRNRNYLSRWEEFWRMWRGQWDPSDRNRNSERSRLIAPALSQAIEASVAEAEEALLSREVWFDLADDIADEDKLDATLMRDQLLEDLDSVNAKSTISEAILNSAIFGTGIIKVNTDVATFASPARDPETNALIRKEEERAIVELQSYRPDQVIPDPAGVRIKDMCGIALEHTVPAHSILEKIESGIYRADAKRYLGGSTMNRREGGSIVEDRVQPGDTEVSTVIEYHGKVPAKFLNKLTSAKSELDSIIEVEAEISDTTMVEAIVTYSDDSTLLRAIPTPFVMRDRSIIACNWENVPGRFWGRGVSEKGYNPQKALDAEMRARADALGFISAPMLGIDAGRIPRGFKPEVKPGKVWLTQGPPDEILRPVQIGALEPSTFNQTQELSQMVQMGTGAFDTAASLRGNSTSGGNGATSSSVALGSFVKRSKRAVNQIDRNLLQPIIQKVALRYMQFDPIRYPFNETKFAVKAAMGIVAREMEQVNLTQLIGMLPDAGTQTKLAAAGGFIELSSVLNKAEILQALQADREQAQAMAVAEQEQQQKAAEAEQRLQEIALESETLKNQQIVATIRKLLAEAESEERTVDIKEVQQILEGQRIQLQGVEIEQFGRQNDIAEKRLDLQEKTLAMKAKQNNGSS